MVAALGWYPRFGSDETIQWFEIEESFLFHVANAWEAGDEIVLQACRSDRGRDRDQCGPGCTGATGPLARVAFKS